MAVVSMAFLHTPGPLVLRNGPSCSGRIRRGLLLPVSLRPMMEVWGIGWGCGGDGAVLGFLVFLARDAGPTSAG
ncbi:hypothetical protein ADK54_30230 [Streptomyces sp. WM6378]|nr:hypothetical protein ADK54_30230 [Streptomyces sp. WM6378]